ncbi:MAG: hypothetical protein K5641_08015 [Lachnospiraceae bacterium]|nr:hypothetical protein [Lachnospiraceae bacterium]
MEKEERRVGGYLFGSDKDVELARAEQAKITYLEEKMQYSNPKSVLSAYNKLVEGRVFTTPVGFKYLEKLRDFLIENGLKDAICVIPLHQVYSYDPEEDRPKRPFSSLEKDREQRELRRLLRGSLILNIFLLILIIGMFVISITGDSPTILNYERTVQNKYAEWDAELTKREEVIREKERSLQITDQNTEQAEQ